MSHRLNNDGEVGFADQRDSFRVEESDAGDANGDGQTNFSSFGRLVRMGQ